MILFVKNIWWAAITNFGRSEGWLVMCDSQVVAELHNYQRCDTFWGEYKIANHCDEFDDFESDRFIVLCRKTKKEAVHFLLPRYGRQLKGTHVVVRGDYIVFHKSINLCANVLGSILFRKINYE